MLGNPYQLLYACSEEIKVTRSFVLIILLYLNNLIHTSWFSDHEVNKWVALAGRVMYLEMPRSLQDKNMSLRL